jgi:hypothetical protein
MTPSRYEEGAMTPQSVRGGAMIPYGHREETR